MGRPRQSIIRDYQLNFSLTKAEYESITARALKAGMRLPDYGRWLLLKSPKSPDQPVRPVAQIDQLTYQQLRRLGNNLNQIARHLNTYRLPAPPALEPLLRDIRNVLNRGARL